MQETDRKFHRAVMARVAPTGHPMIDTLSRGMRTALQMIAQGQDGRHIPRITQRALNDRGLVGAYPECYGLTDLGRRTAETLRSFETRKA
jgi:hypothetical protein